MITITIYIINHQYLILPSIIIMVLNNEIFGFGFIFRRLVAFNAMRKQNSKISTIYNGNVINVILMICFFSFGWLKRQKKKYIYTLILGNSNRLKQEKKIS